MKYFSDSERSRFKAFKDGLIEVDRLNAAVKARNGTEVYGITKFSDFNPQELSSGTIERKNFESKFFSAAEMPAYKSVRAEGPYGET